MAIGVRDIDRSLAFYRDLLGFDVTHERISTTSVPSLLSHPDRATRREVQLRWSQDPDDGFLELSHVGPPSGEPIFIDQIGVHHLAFWVDDLSRVAEQLKQAGVVFHSEPAEADHHGPATPRGGGTVRTCVVADPDGFLVQLEERV